MIPETAQFPPQLSWPSKIDQSPGANVYLKIAQPVDGESLTELMRKSRPIHRPWVSPPTDLVMYKRLIDRCKRNELVCYLIYKTEGDQVVGYTNLIPVIGRASLDVEIAFVMGLGFIGQGYMKQAIELLETMLSGQGNIQRMFAVVHPDNANSIGLLKSLEFQHIGQEVRISNRNRGAEEHLSYEKRL